MIPLIFSDIEIITGSEDGTSRIWGKNLAFFSILKDCGRKLLRIYCFPLQLVCFCIKSHGLVLRSMCLWFHPDCNSGKCVQAYEPAKGMELKGFFFMR